MISVVIPAYNEEKMIGSCLHAFEHQTSSEKFEIILVNNNCTDKTVEIAKSFKGKLDIKIMVEKEKGRGPARKKGFEQAKGDILFSTDADTIVPPNWIEKLLDILQNNDTVAVTGTCKIEDESRFTNICFNLAQPLFMRLYRILFHHYWLSGFNFAIYKEVYKQSGGFHTKLNAQEDIELSFRVSKIGKIKFIPDIPVLCSGRRFKKGLMKGLFPYISTFIKYFFYKKSDVVLSDVR
jgi:glycosyltransferase involved in cell wall biosynthesis